MPIKNQKENPFDFRMEASGDVVKMYLYGDVMSQSWYYEDQIVPTEVKNALEEAAGKDLEIHIHSPGGDAYAGFAIYSLFKAYAGKKVMIIDGLAASAASIIAMSADELKISNAGILMIHNAWTYTWGNHNDLRKSANDLEKLSNNGAKLYQQRTGKTLEEIKQLMDDDTYMTADEALSLGFVDEVLYSADMKMHLAKNSLMWGSLDISDYLKVIQNKNSRIKQNQVQNSQNQPIINQEGGNMPEKLTLETLKSEHKEIYQQAIAEAKAEAKSAELERIKAIEEIALPGHEELKKNAIENSMSAGDFALALVQAEKKVLSNAKTAQQKAIENSNVNNVTAEPIENTASGTNLAPEDKDAKFLQSYGATVKKFNGEK